MVDWKVLVAVGMSPPHFVRRRHDKKDPRLTSRRRTLTWSTERFTCTWATGHHSGKAYCPSMWKWPVMAGAPVSGWPPPMLMV